MNNYARAAGARILDNKDKPRHKSDFYPTVDNDVTKAFLASPKGVEMIKRCYIVREPACGRGNMSTALEAVDLTVISTDLEDYGYGDVGIDFMTDTDPRGCQAMVTNPPFTLPGRKNGQVAFLEKSVELGYEFVAMFAKTQFWNASTRLKAWDMWTPAAVYPLTWRPDFTGAGAPTMDCCWIVWDRNHSGPCEYLPLRKPT